MIKKSKILDSQAIEQKIRRLSWQIYEDNLAEREIVIVGIAGRGEILAAYLSNIIAEISSIRIKIGTIHIDKEDPYKNEIKINLDVSEYTNKVVILADDVLNSGKTLMYASKYFLTTPMIRLSTVVLVERMHNRFPIKADYVGLSLATTLQEYITVSLQGNTKGVYLS
tara:strand:- start:36507 stop:37010 length:504 start_codon:yes stop_codon:yes gene_type:complete